METKNIILKLRTGRECHKTSWQIKSWLQGRQYHVGKMEIPFQIRIHLSSYRKNLMSQSIRFRRTQKVDLSVLRDAN